MSIIQNSNTFTQPKLNDQTKQSANKESNNNSKMNLFTTFLEQNLLVVIHMRLLLAIQ